MIRINLLGTPKPKKAKRSPVVTFAPEGGPSPLLMAVVIGVLTIAGNYFWYSRLTTQREDNQKQLTQADTRIRALSGVQTRYQEKEKQAKELKRRFDVIDQLRATQYGPVAMLNTISDTVNSTDAVWLNSVKDEGANITVDGVALSNVAVANLISNLKKSGHFKNVELKETLQDDYKKVQAFNFVLVCEKAPEKKS